MSGRSKSFVENATEAMQASFAGNGSFEKQQVDEEKEMRRKLKEIKAIAKRLEGPVQKYPRSGKGLFKKMQDRYIAAIPFEDPSANNSGACDDKMSIESWKSG